MSALTAVCFILPAGPEHAVVSRPETVDDLTWRSVGQRLRAHDDAGAYRIEIGAVPRAEQTLRRLFGWTVTVHRTLTARLQARDETASALQTVLAAPAVATDGELARLRADLQAAGFVRPLREFQQQAAVCCTRTGTFANFSVPGAGKTTVTLATAAVLLARGTVDRVLVVAPLSAHEAWQTDSAACLAQPPRLSDSDVLTGADTWALVNYERLSNVVVWDEITRWVRAGRTLVVFDEAHRAKAGPASRRGAQARELAGLATCVQTLTGTPMPNRPSDLEAVFDLAWPGHGARLVNGDLAARRARAFVRATKSDLGLPPMTMTVERVQVDPAHRTVLEAMEGLIWAAPTATEADLADKGKALMRLIAACTSPQAVLGDGTVSAVAQSRLLADLEHVVADLDSAVRPVKLLRAAQLVAANAARGRKTLVWASFHGSIAGLRDVLAPYGPAVVTGRTPFDDPVALTDRQREIARFRTDPDCHVLVATPQTLAEGISLHQVCIDQVHVDRTFATGTYLQALDRTHRLGLAADADPTCTVLVAANTVDERVQDRLSVKAMALAMALDDPDLLVVADPQQSDVDVDLWWTDGVDPTLGGLLDHLVR